MKRYFLFTMFIFFAVSAHAGMFGVKLQKINKGPDRRDFNLTITSGTAIGGVDQGSTILSTTEASICNDVDFIVRTSTLYTSYFSSFSTTGSDCRMWVPGEAYSFGGRNNKPVYGKTADETSNSARIDGAIFKD